ncbi:Nuclear cap-binding protein subunit 3 [Nymphon striatum]|nr:Nuclear cap-binding protein subunit 3 [Nymphon striatum]
MATTENLPNLKISVENSSVIDDVVQLEDLDQDDSLILEETNGNQVEVKINLDNLAPSNNQVRNYENPQSAIIDGQDLAEVQKKLQGRASRFGLKDNEVSKKFCEITDDDIKQLYQSLKVTETDKKNRLSAIHMRGVEEMSTEDIFSYFSKFFPASVEWINDISCNVLWGKDEDAAKAMILLSVKIIKQQKHADKTTPKEVEHKNDIEMDNVVVISNDDEEEYYDCEMETSDDSPLEKSVSENNISVPIPPGYWRSGIPHEKAKAILLRFATADDRKIKGAEKISKFYRKYGNPNFSGLQGIISNSRKRKLKSGTFKDFEKTFQSENETFDDVPKTDDMHLEERSSEGITTKEMSKVPRQKMYADIEEDRQRNLKKRIAITAPREEFEDKEDDLRTLLKNKRRKSTPSAFSRLFYRSDRDKVRPEILEFRDKSRHEFHKGDSTDLRSKLSTRSKFKDHSTFSIEESDESEDSD